MVSLWEPGKCALIWMENKPPQRPNMNVRRRTSLSNGREPVVCVEVPSRGCRAGWWAETTRGVVGTHKHNSPWVHSCCCVLLMSGSGGSPRRQTPSRQGPCRALVNRGLWLVTHPGEPKALRWSQNIFGLSTNDRYYGSTFLSWNLKPKALSC